MIVHDSLKSPKDLDWQLVAMIAMPPPPPYSNNKLNQTKPNHTKPYQTIPLYHNKPNHTKLYTLYTETNKLPITNFQLPITNFQLPITNFQLLITNFQLPITNCQLPITIWPKNISISSQFSYEFDSIELHSCFTFFPFLLVHVMGNDAEFH